MPKLRILKTSIFPHFNLDGLKKNENIVMVIENWRNMNKNSFGSFSISGFQVDARILVSDWSTNQASIWLAESAISTKKNLVVVYDVI